MQSDTESSISRIAVDSLTLLFTPHRHLSSSYVQITFHSKTVLVVRRTLLGVRLSSVFPGRRRLPDSPHITVPPLYPRGILLNVNHPLVTHALFSQNTAARMMECTTNFCRFRMASSSCLCIFFLNKLLWSGQHTASILGYKFNLCGWEDELPSPCCPAISPKYQASSLRARPPAAGRNIMSVYF